MCKNKNAEISSKLRSSFLRSSFHDGPSRKGLIVMSPHCFKRAVVQHPWKPAPNPSPFERMRVEISCQENVIVNELPIEIQRQCGLVKSSGQRIRTNMRADILRVAYFAKVPLTPNMRRIGSIQRHPTLNNDGAVCVMGCVLVYPDCTGFGRRFLLTRVQRDEDKECKEEKTNLT